MHFEELENQHHNNPEEKNQNFSIEHKRLNNLFPVEVLNEFNNNNHRLKLQLTQLARVLKKNPIN